MQGLLTEIWNDETWPLQSTSPASRLVRILRELLNSKINEYTFVDCCAGAGGPTPFLETQVNDSIDKQMRTPGDEGSSPPLGNGQEAGPGSGGHIQYVDFILTDLHPHVPAWQDAGKTSRYGSLRYVPEPVDATTFTKEVLELAQPPRGQAGAEKKETRVFRLFNLAFHHFDDELALQILRNTLQTSDGFAIFELQGRDLGNILTLLSSFPLLVLGSWWWYWGQWKLLFWSGVVPVVPFVFVFDGLISCLRTRRESEMTALLKRAAMSNGDGLSGWTVKSGEEKHTWPFGMLSYYVGIKN